MNHSIINEFEKLIEYHKQQNTNKFRITAFNKALNAIKSMNFEITHVEQVKNISGIGKGTQDRINEILTSGKLSEIKDTNSELNELIRISGIGPAKASALYTEGITLKKLQNDPCLVEEHLNHHQKIGLKYLEDIESRIPYDEISSIEKYLSKIIKNIDPKLRFTICGSYRRKKETSGDIDILLYYEKENYENNNILKDVIYTLTKKKFLIDNLTEAGLTKYMGICRINTNCKARRIDVRYIKTIHYPYALLYFTGSGEFNKNMRVHANKLGFKLNEYYLMNLETEEEIYLNSEREIFEYLKLTYVEPRNRINNVT